MTCTFITRWTLCVLQKKFFRISSGMSITLLLSTRSLSLQAEHACKCIDDDKRPYIILILMRLEKTPRSIELPSRPYRARRSTSSTATISFPPQILASLSNIGDKSRVKISLRVLLPIQSFRLLFCPPLTDDAAKESGSKGHSSLRAIAPDH